MSPTATERLEALEGQYPINQKGRLSFQQKCAAYCLLRRRFSKAAVARVFAISSVTAARLAKASETSRIHTDVAKEYHRLGPDEFNRIYFTDEIETKLAEALQNAKPKSAGFSPNPTNPSARLAAGFWLIPATGEYPAEAFHVHFIEGEGWALSGRETTQPDRFASSTKARNHGYTGFDFAPIRISEDEARAIWAEKISNEVDKDVDKPNEVD